MKTNDKSPANDDLTAGLCTHFSHEIAHITLNVYGSLERLGTINAISRTRTITTIYKKDKKKILLTIDEFYFWT